MKIQTSDLDVIDNAHKSDDIRLMEAVTERYSLILL